MTVKNHWPLSQECYGCNNGVFECTYDEPNTYLCKENVSLSLENNHCPLRKVININNNVNTNENCLR